MSNRTTSTGHPKLRIGMRATAGRPPHDYVEGIITLTRADGTKCIISDPRFFRSGQDRRWWKIEEVEVLDRGGNTLGYRANAKGVPVPVRG